MLIKLVLDTSSLITINHYGFFYIHVVLYIPYFLGNIKLSKYFFLISNFILFLEATSQLQGITVKERK